MAEVGVQQRLSSLVDDRVIVEGHVVDVVVRAEGERLRTNLQTDGQATREAEGGG